jgi:hypothetical protein
MVQGHGNKADMGAGGRDRLLPIHTISRDYAENIPSVPMFFVRVFSKVQSIILAISHSSTPSVTAVFRSALAS